MTAFDFPGHSIPTMLGFRAAGPRRHLTESTPLRVRLRASGPTTGPKERKAGAACVVAGQKIRFMSCRPVMAQGRSLSNISDSEITVLRDRLLMGHESPRMTDAAGHWP